MHCRHGAATWKSPAVDCAERPSAAIEFGMSDPNFFFTMKINLNWKRPLLYCLIPVFIVLVFVGFPPPFAPPRATKPGQEQSAPEEKKET